MGNFPEAVEDLRSDHKERFEQLKPFDEMENQLVALLIKPGHNLPSVHERTLRRAINLSRVWLIQLERDQDIVLGPKLMSFRTQVYRILQDLATIRSADELGVRAETLRPLLEQNIEALTQSGKISRERLFAELNEKKLILVLGGGGGSGYAHLGIFSALARIGLVPHFLVGSSMGAILGLFRARSKAFHESNVEQVASQLSFKSLFHVLSGETRYAMPGTFRLHLQQALASSFEDTAGNPLALEQLDIPFWSVVTGVQSTTLEKIRKAQSNLAPNVTDTIQKGAFSRLLHAQNLIQKGALFFQELRSTPGALQPIPLGQSPLTRSFNAVDAVGYSAAIPALIQYDVTRPDVRMHKIIEQVLEEYGVSMFADGGLSANLPVRFAWEAIQDGFLGTRNTFIAAFDCFAPQISRHLLFLPLQRMAKENVDKHRPFAHFCMNYRRVPSPLAVVPGQKTIQSAIENGRKEFKEYETFVQKMMEPLYDTRFS